MADLGTDLAGVFDLSFGLVEASGRRALAEAVARRWITIRGTLIYDRTYGAGLSTYLHSSVDGLQTLGVELEREAMKDERVLDATVSVELAGETLTIRGQLVDAEGPFALTLSSAGLTVDYLRAEI